MTDVPARARPTAPLPVAPSTGAVARFFDSSSPEGLFVLSAVAQYVGAVGQFGPYFLQRSDDGLVVGEIGGAFVDGEGTIEIGYAVVESQCNRGYATAAV